MSIAGSFRPGHTEHEVLRNYVVDKTVEEVVVSRKAQLILGDAGTPRTASSRHQPRPPPGSRRGSARGPSSARARVHARLAVHPTLASARGSARTQRAGLAKAAAIARPPGPPQPPAHAQLARVQQLMAGLEELMATPAEAFGNVHALAAMAPPPLAALLKRGTPGSSSRRQRGVSEAAGSAPQPSPAPELSPGAEEAAGSAPQPNPAPELSPGAEVLFARELLAGWVAQAIDVYAGPPEDSIFERLLVANTASKLGKTRRAEAEPAPAPEPEPEPRLQGSDCTMGNVACVVTNSLEARAACRDVQLNGHPAHSWTPEKEARCGTVGQVVGVHRDEAVRLRFFDGELQWFAREALRPAEFGSALAPERPLSSALIETGGLHYLSPVLTTGSCFKFVIHVDRLPSACAHTGIVCGIMAVTSNALTHAPLPEAAELSEIRERSLSLENTYIGLHQLEECASNGPACFHEGKMVTMTCDLRTSALGLPAVMIGQPADNLIDAQVGNQRQLEQNRNSWIGSLRFECDLLQLAGAYVPTCKVPAPPALATYRAFIRLPFVDKGELTPQFFVSWFRGESAMN